MEKEATDNIKYVKKPKDRKSHSYASRHRQTLSGVEIKKKKGSVTVSTTSPTTSPSVTSLLLSSSLSPLSCQRTPPSPCYRCWKRAARCGEGEGDDDGDDMGDAPCCCRICWKRRFRFSRSSIRFCWRVLRLAWNIRMSSSEMPQSPSSSSSSSHDNALC